MASMEDAYGRIFSSKKRIMLVFAHPDDAEIYAGGTIARLVSDHKQVKLVKMTTGNKGSRDQIITEADLAKTRESEDQAALAVLGLTDEDNSNLDLGDGQLVPDMTTLEKMVSEIRLFKPDLVITHNPENVLIRDLGGSYYVNHRDHRATGLTVVDATYPYSRDTLFFPDQLKTITPHTVTEYLFVDSWGHQDTAYIDVTDFAEVKTRAIAAHHSQYTQEKAQSSTDYFAPVTEGRRFEQFRYVVAD